jgi:hypothetical protein
MISPLLGPSTIIHVFVIIIGGGIKFSKKAYKNLWSLNDKKNRVKLYSVIIILTVCIVMLAASYYVVFLGLKSGKSNLNIIENILEGRSADAGLIVAPSATGGQFQNSNY